MRSPCNDTQYINTTYQANGHTFHIVADTSISGGIKISYDAGEGAIIIPVEKDYARYFKAAMRVLSTPKVHQKARVQARKQIIDNMHSIISNTEELDKQIDFANNRSAEIQNLNNYFAKVNRKGDLSEEMILKNREQLIELMSPIFD